MTQDSSSSAVMRSKLGQARGLGTARAGFHHWWSQKVTSFALIPLTLWFVWSCLHLRGLDRAAVGHWVANPLVAALLVSTIVMTFHHLQIGLEAVVVDYVREEKRKLATLLVIKAGCVLLALTAVIAVLKLAFTG
jgi:succinate dehydrogenase / fumarate reductase membrane anchor subunit